MKWVSTPFLSPSTVKCTRSFTTCPILIMFFQGLTYHGMVPDSPIARPHQRPAEGDPKKIPPFRDHRRIRPSVPHHLITLHPAPSHWVVRLQSGFPRDAYVGPVRENISYDINTPPDNFDDDLSRQTRNGTVRDKDIFGASRHKAQRPTIRT